MGSKLKISPYLFNHQYDSNNPKITRPYSQSVKARNLGTHKVHSTQIESSCSQNTMIAHSWMERKRLAITLTDLLRRDHHRK